MARLPLDLTADEIIELADSMIVVPTDRLRVVYAVDDPTGSYAVVVSDCGHAEEVYVLGRNDSTGRLELDLDVDFSLVDSVICGIERLQFICESEIRVDADRPARLTYVTGPDGRQPKTMEVIR